MAHNKRVHFFAPLYALAWFPSFSGPECGLGNSFNWFGLLLLCGPATGSCGSRTWDSANCSTNHHGKPALIIIITIIIIIIKSSTRSRA